MKVLSLFDGISCGMVALERIGIPVEKYVAYEIEPDAIKVPNGRLWRDDYSPYDCSRSASVQVKPFVQKSIATSDFRVGGGRGYWSRGEYRMEFWYNDKICLYTATFTIR